MEEKLTQKEKEIFEKLKEVTDPEFGQSIVERNLIDSIRFKDGIVEIIYHLTVPFCPMPFALYIGRQIRRKAKGVSEVKKVKVKVKDHAQTDVINKILEKEEV
ncbi:MAG: iron-sulfur cluster assembly protein [Candidatus Bathyarchaeia archaeon]